MTSLVTAILLFFIGVVSVKLLRHGLQIQISTEMPYETWMEW